MHALWAVKVIPYLCIINKEKFLKIQEILKNNQSGFKAFTFLTFVNKWSFINHVFLCIFSRGTDSSLKA